MITTLILSEKTSINIKNNDATISYENTIVDCLVKLEISSDFDFGSTKYVYIKPSKEDLNRAWLAACDLHKSGVSIDFNYNDTIIEMGHISDLFENAKVNGVVLRDGRYAEYKGIRSKDVGKIRNDLKIS